MSSTALALAYKVQEAWVARYNGPDNAMDTGNAVAVDEQGNVYVAGGTGNLGPGSGTNDYAILKYNPNGNLLWAQRYNGPGSGPYLNDDTASALAVDNQGNVYVTGLSRGNDTTYDYATLKYDPYGNLLWVQRYSNPDSYDMANALAVDNQGNVYVTGVSGEDYATLKYDTNGNLLWAQRYDGSNGYDSASALAVDAQGNVYVTGSSAGSGTAGFGDYTTLKYDPHGNLLWVQRYNVGINWANANDIAVDRLGNAYVTGAICTANSVDGWCINTDYATLKYDTNGKRLWAQRYNGPGKPGNNTDEAYALAVDNQGNVYVTGSSQGSGTNTDYATLKYDFDGKLQWEQRYNGLNTSANYAKALTVDAQGNVYITGYSVGANDGTDVDVVTIKYSQ